METHVYTLRARRLGIDTYQAFTIYMSADCPICRSEGFEAQSRLEVSLGDRRIVATLNVVTGPLLAGSDAGLSESAWIALGAREGDSLSVGHAPPLDSMSHVRAKVYGHRLDGTAFDAIVADVAAGRYSDLHLSAFVTACAGDRLDLAETTSLTRSMVFAGERLAWPDRIVVDKHCIGGLPGNRTTLIVVPIVAACGLTIPKTSSRAITSPAGTADTMEVLAPVDFDLDAMRRVVERTGACIVWGGSVRLSPADDMLIRVERPLDLDSEGQLVASVLSKKIAAGSTHVLIDLPVGPTAKVRSTDAARALGERLVEVGRALGLHVALAFTDGAQPVGRGIGPALEARDVLAVLQGAPDAPRDLRERALRLAGELLELGGAAVVGEGLAVARAALDDGRAWRTFQRICAEQGGLRDVPMARHREVVVAERPGIVAAVDNRLLARVAKLAGAPKDATAGVDVHVQLGRRVDRGEPLFTVQAAAAGELGYALGFARSRGPIYDVREDA